MKYRNAINSIALIFLGFQHVEAQTLNWKTIYEESLEVSHPIKILSLEKEQALTKRKQAQGAYIPKLEVQGKAAYMDARSTLDIDQLQIQLSERIIDIPDLNTHLNTNGFVGTAAAEASFLLFSGTKVTHLSNAALASSEAQEALKEKASQELLLEVLTLLDQYALLLASDELILIAQENLEENQKVAEKAYEYGVITSYEKEQVHLAANELEVKKVKLNGQKQLLLSKLSQLTNHQIQQEEVEWPILEEIRIVLNKDDEVLRPEIQALNAKLKAESSLIKLHKSWWIPQLQAKASLGYLDVHHMNVKGETPLPIQNSPIDFRIKNAYLWPQWQIGVGMKWNIFDGLNGIRETQIAQMEKQKTEHQKSEATSLIKLEQEKYLIEMQTLLEEVKAYTLQASYRKRALEIAENEFKLGLIKSTDLVDANFKYQEAKMEEIQAIFKQRQSIYQQLRAKGSLTVSSLQSIIK